MKVTSTLICATMIALSPVVVSAGGFDLTGQPINVIFEEGNYVEMQVGILSPSVEGGIPTSSFGNVANDTPFLTAGAKTDFTDRFSGAVLLDTPFKRSTTYESGLYTGTSADVEANTITFVGRYKISDNFSVYAGPRVQRASIDLTGPTAILPYAIDVKDTGYGFVAGASAEIPEYKARVALTYNSEIDHSFKGGETIPTRAGLVPFNGKTDIHTPQSVNLEVQGPVSKSTLVRANIRWVEWGGVDLAPPGFAAVTGGLPVVEYTEDTITYRLTVAQKINENFAGFVTGSYEADGGENISLFKTVDGSVGLGGGVVYQNEDGLKLTLSGEYYWLEGTSGRQVASVPVSSSFDDTNGFGLSFKVGYSF